jgi:excisionase family DNA binding protein
LEEQVTESTREWEKKALSFREHSEGFKKVGFNNNKKIDTRIIRVLYDLHIHTLEELAKTPASTLLKIRNIGSKTIECIRATLESQGFILGKDWNLGNRNRTEKTLKSPPLFLPEERNVRENKAASQQENPVRGELVTVKEGAKRIHLSITNTYGCIHRGEIPFFRPPVGKILFDTADLDDYMRKSKVPTGTVLENI